MPSCLTGRPSATGAEVPIWTLPEAGYVSRVTTRRARVSSPGRGAVLAWLVGVEAIGAISAMLARRGAWFDTLRKPAWTAPGWLFESTRTLFLALLAIAAWLVWRERARVPVRLPLIWFGIMLALSALWAPLLHGLRRPDLAMLCLSALWVTIVMTMISFHRIKAAAGWLLLPWLLWITYAAALVLSIWVRNG